MSKPPEKDRKRVRNKRLEIRLCEEQLRKWHAKAQRMGLTLSDWLQPGYRLSPSERCTVF